MAQPSKKITPTVPPKKAVLPQTTPPKPMKSSGTSRKGK